MKILRVLVILLALAWAGSVHARCYLPDQVVPFDGYFHDDTGTLTDPSSPAAVLRITPLAGTAAYSALSAPAQINSETGRYGGEYTIPSSPTYGTYEISVKGDVPTSKTTGKVVTTFIVAASCPATASAIAALPTAAENRAEMDSNSTQLAAIVEDTNELQGDDYPAVLATLATAAGQTTAQNDLDLLTGSDGATLATAQGNYAPAKATDIVSGGAITTSGGAVTTVTTAVNLTSNNDKTGYSLTQTFPPNFGDLAITGTTGRVDVASIEGAGATSTIGSSAASGVWTSSVPSSYTVGQAGYAMGNATRGLMQYTTIATLSTQTSFTLTAGSADDNAYNGAIMVIEDASTSFQKAAGVISDYVGSSKTITLQSDPAIFTMAVGDKVAIFATDQLSVTALTMSDVLGTDPSSYAGQTNLGGRVEDTHTHTDVVSATAVVPASGSCAESGGVTFDTSLTQPVDDYWRGAFVVFIDGDLANQGGKLISAYDGTTDVGCITVRSNLGTEGFTGAPANGDTFWIINK